MPQLDPASFASQLFWLTVTFVFLYVMLAKHILPRIQTILQGRKDRIDHSINRAAQMKEEAEDAKNTYEKALARSRGEAQQLMAGTTKASEQLAAAKQAELDAVIAEKLAASEAAISTARKEAMDRLTPVAGELTALIVEKLVKVKPTGDQVSKLVGTLTKT